MKSNNDLIRTWKEWDLDKWAESSPHQKLNTVDLWRTVLEFNKNWTESDLRRQYMGSTYQANEVNM